MFGINKMIEDYFGVRGLRVPTTEQAALWLGTEFGEMCEELVLKSGEWVRNTPEKNFKTFDRERLCNELADIIFMAIVTGMQEGLDPLDRMIDNIMKHLQPGHTNEKGGSADCKEYLESRSKDG